jgi:hypothetical protein
MKEDITLHFKLSNFDFMILQFLKSDLHIKPMLSSNMKLKLQEGSWNC